MITSSVDSTENFVKETRWTGLGLEAYFRRITVPKTWSSPLLQSHQGGQFGGQRIHCANVQELSQQESSDE